MAFVLVSNTVRTAVKNLLADSSVGFNPVLATIADTLNVRPFVIDYSTKSKKFFAGWYVPKELEATTAFVFPIQCLYSQLAANQNLDKFQTFSGTVQMSLDTYTSYGKSSAPSDTETLGDAVEATLVNVFNKSDNYSFFAGTGVLYNGDLVIRRSPMQLDGNNWLQKISTTFTVELSVS